MNQNLQCTRCGGAGHLAKDCGMPVVGGQPEALRYAEMCDAAARALGGPASNIAAVLRAQHAAIERKDALLRQCLKHVASNISMTSDGTETEELYDAITKELQ